FLSILVFHSIHPRFLIIFFALTYYSFNLPHPPLSRQARSASGPVAGRPYCAPALGKQRDAGPVAGRPYCAPALDSRTRVRCFHSDKERNGRPDTGPSASFGCSVTLQRSGGLPFQSRKSGCFQTRTPSFLPCT